MDDLKLFVKHDLLVLSRGGLYHSLYDLNENKVLFNQESPWNAADNAGEDMNAWIKRTCMTRLKPTDRA